LIEVNKYGINWLIIELNKSSGNYVHLSAKNNGLCWEGVLNCDLYKGPFLALVHIKSRDRALYNVQGRFRLYSPELEQFGYKNQELKRMFYWYHILQDKYTFSKSMFKPYGTRYRMSLTSALKKDADVTYDDILAVANLFNNIPLYSPQFREPDMYIIRVKSRDFLVINDNIYNNLPSKWTVQDLTSLLDNQKNSVYQMYEQFWQEIAEHRAKNKPVKLLINNKDIQIVREEFSKYGINSIVKMPKSINYVIQEMEVTK